MDALIVGLTRRVRGLRDEQRAVLPEEPHATHVIGVALRQHDVTRRRGAHRVEVALVHLRLEPHAGVDDDPSRVRHDEVRVRHAGRHPYAGADVDRGRRARRAHGEEVGLVADVVGEHGIAPGRRRGWRARNGNV